jgi:hypothetical protein
VADVVVRAPLGLSRAHRQKRLCAIAIEGLDLRVLIHAKHRSSLGRIEVKAYDVAHLLDEQRIARELEGFCAMRLQNNPAADSELREYAMAAVAGKVL